MKKTKRNKRGHRTFSARPPKRDIIY